MAPGRAERLEIDRATADLPATYFAFDLLGFEDFDLRRMPLSKRNAILRDLLPPVGVMRCSDPSGRAAPRYTRRPAADSGVAAPAPRPRRSGERR